MAAGIYNFTIEQGATFTRVFKYKNSEGEAINLTGHAIRMQLRENIEAPTPIISLDVDVATSNGSTISLSGTGFNEITVTIDADDTAAMSFNGAVYDLEIENNGIVTRILQGKIKLSKEVTRD